jgi:hypothetical protein
MKHRVPFDIQFLLESLTNVPINNAHRPKLDEDPDDVLGGADNGTNLNWSDEDNVAFMCTKDWSIIMPQGTHWQMMNGIVKSYQRSDTSFEFMEDDGCTISDIDALARDVYDIDGIIHDHVEKTARGRVGKNFRSNISGLLTGRLWRQSQVMSFWNSQEDVIKQWNCVEKMFHDFHNRFGSIWDYAVDWVERNDEKIPLTPVSDVSDSADRNTHKDQMDYENEPEVDTKGQMNFFAKMFKSPILLNKLSDAQLEQIRNKMHVLDPQVKAQIMKANHSAIVNKAAEIAEKLGMSVSEFHSLWSMDEKINESPDSFVMNKKQRQMFANRGYLNGADLHKIAYYDRDDAVGFLIDIAGGVTVYNPVGMGDVRLTHPSLGAMVMGYIAYPNDYKTFPVKGAQGYAFDLSDEADEPPPSETDIGTVAVLQANNPVELMKRLNVLADDLPLDGDVPRKDTRFIQGRVWMKHKAVSFWGTRAFILKHFDLVNDLFVGLKLNKEKMMYEFLDSKHLYTYDELTGKSIETRTKEEMDRLMAIQHLDPRAKKKLAMMQNALKQKGSPGWDFQAQKNAALPALQEDPDRVMITPDSKAVDTMNLKKYQSLHWKDTDAISFVFDVGERRSMWIAADEVQAANPKWAGRPNHAAMIRQIAYYRRWPGNFTIQPDNKNGFSLESRPGTDPTQIWFAEGGLHGMDFKSREDFDAYLAMADWSDKVGRENLPKSFILGRYWRGSKLISFWQNKSNVLANFEMVENFLSSFGVDAEDAAYEFIDIKKVFVYDELFQEDDEKYKRSSDEISDLLKRQHTDPSAKKKLKDLGYYDRVKTGARGTGGFDYRAQKDAALPALQELVKRFNIVK